MRVIKPFSWEIKWCFQTQSLMVREKKQVRVRKRFVVVEKVVDKKPEGDKSDESCKS